MFTQRPAEMVASIALGDEVEERVRGRIIISTTTNGTRALRACATAPTVAIAGFLNLGATAKWLTHLSPNRVVLVCAGTAEFAALEDVLAAGALCACLPGMEMDDSAAVVQRAYHDARKDLREAVATSRNGSRLLGHSELRDDVELCLRRDVYDFAAVLDSAGIVRRVE